MDLVATTAVPGNVEASNRSAQFDDLTTLLRHRSSSNLTVPSKSGLIAFYSRKTGTYSASSHHEFLIRAGWIAKGLHAKGFESGQKVVIACATPEAMLIAYCASLLGGYVPTIMPIRPTFDDQAAIRARIELTLAIVGTDSPVLRESPAADRFSRDQSLAATFYLDELEELGTSSIYSSIELNAPVQELAHIQLTSGSTGTSKGVAVTHASLLANVSALVDRFEMTQNDRFASWLPLYHDMGLVIKAVLSLSTGADLYLMSPFDFLADPFAWLKTISEQSVTFAASPNFGFEYLLRKLEDDQILDLNLESWRIACCGAEPINAATSRAFIDKFQQAGFSSRAFKPSYGLAEATLAVTIPHASDRWRSVLVSRKSLSGTGKVVLAERSTSNDSDENVEIVGLGTPVLGTAVELRKSDGSTILEDLECGEVVVHGTSICAGIIGQPGEIEPFDADGLRTGDVGFLHEGQLFLVDRLKNIIIRNGQNYSAAIFERTLAQAFSISENSVWVFDVDLINGNELVALVELNSGDDVEALAREALLSQDELELPINAVIFVKAGEPSRTTSGKKQHMLARQSLKLGRMRVIKRVALTGSSESSEARGDQLDDTRETLRLVAKVARARGIDVPITQESRLQQDLDFDSLAVIELSAAASEELDIDIPTGSLGRLKTVSDFCSLVSQCRKQGSSGSALNDQLKDILHSIPQISAVVSSQDKRDVVVEGRSIADFASCNYLGMDLHPEVIDSIDPMVRQWGVHPSWTRAVASPQPYIELEKGLAKMIGSKDALVFPTISLLHFGVLPALATNAGVILMDSAAHHSIQEAATLARARGTTVTTFRHGDLDELSTKLKNLRVKSNCVIAVDGVYSMSGETAPIPELQRIAIENGATLYIDDAHGFGILGERPTPEQPYGHGGGGILRHFDLGLENIVYVAGLSKAFSSMAAFVSVEDPAQRESFSDASTMIFGGPIPVASLASGLSAIKVNKSEGDVFRQRLFDLTSELIKIVEDLGLEHSNVSGFPIVNVTIGHPAEVVDACRILWDEGVLITPALFPAAPLDKGGVRFTLTADNTSEQLERVAVALRKIASRRANSKVRNETLAALSPVV